MKRASALAGLALTVAVSACVSPMATTSDAAGEDAPEVQAAPLQPPTVAGGMTTDELTAPGAGLDGGEPPVEEPTRAEAFGPGLSQAEITTLTAPLAQAEAWLAELEVQWDNGMTYSEIFRAWRTVSAETAPALSSFALPDEADETQQRDLAAYYESVQGAHDEWQSTVDFIVTYITNYTPEILITKAYQAVEVHLRTAATLRQSLGVVESERPMIVIEELADL